MTESTLRLTKGNVYGIGRPQPAILGFYNLGPDPTGGTLVCWAYGADGSFRGELARVTLPSDANGPQIALGMQRIVHSPLGPILAWSEHPSAGVYYYVFAWDLLSNRLIICSPIPGGTVVDSPPLSCPFMPPGETRWLYFLFRYKTLGHSDSQAELWKTPLDASGQLLVSAAAATGPFAGWTTIAPAFDATHAHGFLGFNNFVQGYDWRWPLAGGGPAEQRHIVSGGMIPLPSGEQMYWAGADATYDLWIGGPHSGDPVGGLGADGSQGLVRRNRATDAWDRVVAFASPAPHSAAHVTINRTGDVSGYFPYDAADGRVLKLAQPNGGPTYAGNDGADPAITLDQVEGHNPAIAHLCYLTHDWGG